MTNRRTQKSIGASQLSKPGATKVFADPCHTPGFTKAIPPAGGAEPDQKQTKPPGTFMQTTGPKCTLGAGISHKVLHPYDESKVRVIPQTKTITEVMASKPMRRHSAKTKPKAEA